MLNTVLRSTLFIFLLASFISCSDESPDNFVENTNSETTDEFRGGNNHNDNKKNQTLSIVKDWTDLLLQVDQFAEGMRPNATARALAYIYLSSFETYAPFEKSLMSNSGRIPQFDLFVQEDLNGISKDLALNESFYQSVKHFMINIPEEQSAAIVELYENNLSQYSRNLSDSEIDDSNAFGQDIASQIITYSQTDLNAENQILDPQPDSYVPPIGNGYWTFSAEPERALFPYWETVRTFIIDVDNMESVPPLEYSEDTDSEYYAEMMETYNSNNTAREEDNEELWIAEFWSDDVTGLMMSPPARQISIARQLIDQERLSTSKSLELLLKVGFALNDAAVVTWKYKYEYMVMRPSVYIQDYIDSDYQTNLFRLIPWPNPTFPGYPSGHSAFASAAGGVFIDMFDDRTRFTDKTHEGRTEFRGEPRKFNSFSEMASENAFSRIPLGVHIRMDCEEGLRLGYDVSDLVNEYSLKTPRW